MESPPRRPPERRYPLRENRSASRVPPRLPPTRSSSSSSSAAPSPPPTSFARALAFAPPPSSPPASNRHRASSSAALDAATGEAVGPISSEGTTVSVSDIPLMVKTKHHKKKEITSRRAEKRGSVELLGSDQITQLLKSMDTLSELIQKELSDALNTHGVSDGEKRKIFTDLVNKWNSILKEAVSTERGRCKILINKIQELIDKYMPLCLVLGEPEKVSDIQLTASLKQIESLLISAVPELEELKRQRFMKLQDLQGRLIDLWDDLGVTIQKQRPYSFMICNCAAKVDEVVEENALSAELLEKVECEVARLELLLKKSLTEKAGDISTEAESIRNDATKREGVDPTETTHHDQASLPLDTADVQLNPWYGLADAPKLREEVCAWEEEQGKRFFRDANRLKGKLCTEAVGRPHLSAGTSHAAVECLAMFGSLPAAAEPHMGRAFQPLQTISPYVPK
uniref:Uncharacterized protein n=1 Tax=Aegilops tauschii TaxID=37682 RepID=M8CDH0_AEGTA